MNRSKTRAPGTIPFSWEYKPGVSKVTQRECLGEEDFVLKLPPPPCPSELARFSVHDSQIQIPLPPCAFQPPSRITSKKGLIRKHEDPFLAAYKNCTKSVNGSSTESFKNGVKARFRKNMLVFSCKRSCSIRDDNLLSISQLPSERSETERDQTI